MKEEIKKIYSDKKNTKKNFERLLSIEDKIKQKLRNESTLNLCIKSIQTAQKCNRATGATSIDCINKAQRLFTVNKIIKL